jgi:hypothetical protein
MIDSNIKIIDF